jgi:hypothetical protein
MTGTGPTGAGGDAIRFHELLQQWGPAYLERFGTAVPRRQRQVLEKLLVCRTPALGGELFACPACGTFHYTYHSCNDRHCPQCGQTDADQWLADHTSLLLPAPYFLVTFTVPEPLRAWMRSHPGLSLDLLFATSAQALQDLARNPKRLGACLGMLGLLHTWSRTLIYHPHVHYLVPAGGLSLDGRQWVPSRRKFLVHVHPLADHYRTLFHQALQRDAPDLLQTLPARLWKERWVVHCQPAGSGEAALRYLSRYVFKTATGNRDLPLLPDGRVRWRYRESTTGHWQHLDLEPFELIRRFLQHVLPSGFHRVRRFGWLHPAARAKLNRVRALLRQAPVLTDAQRAAWQPPQPEFEPPEPLPLPDRTPLCPHCRRPMTHCGSWAQGQPRPRPPARAPP